MGDAVICRVQEVDETHSAVATMKGMGRKLKSGLWRNSSTYYSSSHWKGWSHAQSLKNLGQSRMVIGQNGRIWLDGEHDGMRSIRAALEVIRETAHTWSERTH